MKKRNKEWLLKKKMSEFELNFDSVSFLAKPESLWLITTHWRCSAVDWYSQVSEQEKVCCLLVLFSSFVSENVVNDNWFSTLFNCRWIKKIAIKFELSI